MSTATKSLTVATAPATAATSATATTTAGNTNDHDPAMLINPSAERNRGPIRTILSQYVPTYDIIFPTRL
jgi:hypothetical protein